MLSRRNVIFLVRILLVFLGVCNSAFAAKPPVLVYKDEYVLVTPEDSSGDAKALTAQTEKITDKFDIIRGADSRYKLVVPHSNAAQLKTASSNQIVTYNPKKDRCKTDPVPGVQCSPNYVMKAVLDPNDPLYTSGQLWGLNGAYGMDAPRAWNLAQGVDEVVVAVIDTGINLSHNDLVDNLWFNPGEKPGNGIDDDNNGFVDDVIGASMITGGAPSDDNGHGTHVAGTICGQGNNARGLTGVVWNCKIIPVKFLEASGSGSLFNAARGIDYVTNFKKRGVNVILSNNSWSGGGFNTVLEDAIKRARDAGVLFVAAAGNSGGNNDISPEYPAAYPEDNVISVAAIDKTGALAGFSNYGPSTVDVAAPGVSILSTYIPGNEYTTLSGTSMAAPHVSGALALLKSRDFGLQYNELRDRLFSTVRPLDSVKNKVKTGGEVNLYKLLGGDSPEPPQPPGQCQKNRFRRCTDKCDVQYKGKPTLRKRCWQSCRQQYDCPVGLLYTVQEMFQ